MTETATNGPPSTDTASTPRLRRVLSLWDLILFGLICVTPSAPVTVYGMTSVSSKGHALDCILLAMVAMVLTAISYGRMAAIYPSAGSAYTYVGRGVHPYLGFLAGWAMTLDYIITPLFCITFGTIWGLGLLEPIYKMSPAEYEVAYIVATAAFTGVITFLNLRGIRTTARTNEVLMAVMGAGLLAFIALAIRYLFKQDGWSGVFSFKPFYNPETFNAGEITTATSFAALTYLGFDSVTTLAEDVKNARRNVLIAVVWCACSPVCSAACWCICRNSFGPTIRCSAPRMPIRPPPS
jgi:putrescine importer